MIQIQLHCNAHGKVVAETSLDDVAGELRHKDCLLWLDVTNPTDEDRAYLQQTFHFHPLAMANLEKTRQRPKLDNYGDYVVLVFAALIQKQKLVPHRFNLFAGQNYVVTVHQGTLTRVKETAQRWQQHTELNRGQRAGMLVYTILDAVVDSYFPAIDELADRMSAVEERIFERFDREMQQQLFEMRRELLVVRRIISPERDILNELIRRESPIFGAESLVYFQDIYDRLLRVIDMLDLYHDMLGSSLDAMLSVMSNRLNQIMRTLTAWSIIFMTVTLIASIYGMNFVNIPELHWHFGYFYALGVMAALAGIMVAIFHRIDWL